VRVAVLAGGRSSEHEVSLDSAGSVGDGLRAAGHEVVWVELARDGTWRHDGIEIALTPGRGLLGADAVFPALHGPFGEDGTVQGLLELLDVPYVGAGVLASSLCMDKVVFKEVLAAAAVPQVASAAVRERRWRAEPEAVLRELAVLGTPVFVKPARLGSSVGIAKVWSESEMGEALEGAFEHDSLTADVFLYSERPQSNDRAWIVSERHRVREVPRAPGLFPFVLWYQPEIVDRVQEAAVWTMKRKPNCMIIQFL